MSNILFFNLTRLERVTNNSAKYIVAALAKCYEGREIPYTLWEEFPPIRDLKRGTSFLLNPRAILVEDKSSVYHKAQYIRLAGRRNYSDFTMYGSKHLDLFPDLDAGLISRNPLLTIEANKIYFKYE